jgi:cytosine/uracil/thiamine/allantoin permease
MVAGMDLRLVGWSPEQSIVLRLTSFCRVGYSISAFFICLTGRVGAVYHISFPVMNRSSFGIYGSLWPVLNRALMAW